QQAMSNVGVFGEATAEDDSTNHSAAMRERTHSQSTVIPGRNIDSSATLTPLMASPGLNTEVDKELIQPSVRTNFADTAFWTGALSTDENGQAQVSLTMPENLTTWNVRVWALGHDTEVGEGHTEVVTRKNLIVRPEGPRF